MAPVTPEGLASLEEVLNAAISTQPALTPKDLAKLTSEHKQKLLVADLDTESILKDAPYDILSRAGLTPGAVLVIKKLFPGPTAGAAEPAAASAAAAGTERPPPALQSFLERLGVAPSPSAAAADVRKFNVLHQGDKPLLHNLRPHGAQPPVPVQLLEPSFQQVISAAWGPTTQAAAPTTQAAAPTTQAAVPATQAAGPSTQPAVTEYDCEFARDLCVAMSDHYPDEASRCNRLQYLLERYLGNTYRIKGVRQFKRKPDLRVKRPGSPVWLMAGEVKKDMHGASGDSGLQGHLYFAEYIRRRQPLLKHSLCPMLLLEVVGPLLRICGMAWATVVVCQPLTPMFNLLDLALCHPEQVLTLARTFSAVRQVLHELADRYPTPAPVVPALSWGHAPEPMPYHLHQLKQQHPRARVQRLGGNKLVYRWDDPDHTPARYVIKYTTQYGADVHSAWAGAGLAPALLSIRQLPGGWLVVTMAFLSCDDGWCPVTALLPQRAVPAAPVPPELQQLGVPFSGARLQQLEQHLLSVLGAAHQVPVHHAGAAQEAEVSPESPSKRVAKGGVHGDMRDPNILIQLPISSTATSCATEPMELLPASSTWDVSSASVQFLDFDWSGCTGDARYPAFLNSSLPWPDGAAMGALILQEHDKQLLQSSLRQQGRTRPPWPWEWDPAAPNLPR